MKTLFRIFAAFSVFAMVLLVAVYLCLTNSGVQTRLLERQLPAGSSIDRVKVTLGKLELSGLVLVLEDGGRLELGDLQGSFEPLAAVFGKTIKFGDLSLTGVRLRLPPVAAAPTSSTYEPGALRPKSPTPPSVAPFTEEVDEPLLLEQLYALGDIDWLFDIHSMRLSGELIDARGSSYTLLLDANTIRPSVRSTLSLSVDSVFSDSLRGGLKSFSSEVLFHFTQSKSGGFENFQIVAKASGLDGAGNRLLYSDQMIEAEIDSVARTASASISFNADLPRPEIFAQELAGIGPALFDVEAAAVIDGNTVTLTKADMSAVANSLEVFSLHLKKSMIVGGGQDFVGELLDLEIDRMPTAWFEPWLGEDLQFSATPISAELSVSGQSDGSLIVRSARPLELRQVNFSSAGEVFIRDLDIFLDPVLSVEPNQSLEFTLTGLRVADRYGDFLSGEVKGAYEVAAAREANPLAGLQAKAALEIQLQPLLQQPALSGRTSIMSGALSYDVSLDSDSEYPVQMQGTLSGLRARSNPEVTKDYRFAAQAKPGKAGSWLIGSSLLAGARGRATTDLQISGGLQPSSDPLKFKLDLKGPRVVQSDLEHLVHAFRPTEVKTPPAESRSSVPIKSSSTSVPVEPIVIEESPPWAMLDGTVSIEVAEFLLNSGRTISHFKSHAMISEAVLKVDQTNAIVEGGQFGGASEIRFAAGSIRPYSIAADFNMKEVDPSVFSSAQGKGFPVQGLFDGKLNLKGNGRTLDEAIDSATLDLDVSGRDGVVTAFEIDDRSALGLGIAGILGQQFDRPGIAALTKTIPYFKDIRFSNFGLKVTRGEDQRMLIPKLRFIGDSLLINGSGFVGAGSMLEIADQPLTLDLELGAKGRLTQYLEILGLLQPAVSEDDFRRWNQGINIGGTLNNPNVDDLEALLREAARSAFSKSEPQAPRPAGTTNGQAQQPNQNAVPVEEKPKEQEIDEVDIAIDLLNSFF